MVLNYNSLLRAQYFAIYPPRKTHFVTNPLFSPSGLAITRSIAIDQSHNVSGPSADITPSGSRYRFLLSLTFLSVVQGLHPPHDPQWVHAQQHNGFGFPLLFFFHSDSVYGGV